MKKLEDIGKNSIFKVPEGYFDRLPLEIQTRVSKPPQQATWSPFLVGSLKYALPVVIIGISAWFYFGNNNGQNAEDILASVNTETLIAYLEEEADLLTDEFILGAGFDDADIEDLEASTYEQIEFTDEEVLELENEVIEEFQP